MSVPGDIEASHDRDQALSYISDMTKELSLVARRHGFDVLSYLLDMAYLEAENAVSQPQPAEAKAKVAHG